MKIFLFTILFSLSLISYFPNHIYAQNQPTQSPSPSLSESPSQTPMQTPDEEKDSKRLVVHLLSYLSKDYGGAVGEDHKIISQSEYNEQKEFAEIIKKSTEEKDWPIKDHKILSDVDNLEKLIKEAASPKEVTELTKSIQSRLITLGKFAVHPTQAPDIHHGKIIFENNCVSCHGTLGKGDGPDGKNLDPAPANFWDEDTMKNLTSFNAFNTISLGVPGTGMPAFTYLTEKEKWDVASYILTIRHSEKNVNAISSALTTDNKSNNSNNTNNTNNTNNPTQVTRSFLQKSYEAYKKGDFKAARTAALMSYLQGVEPIEPILQIKNKKLKEKIEEEMGELRGIIEVKKPFNEFNESFNKILLTLNEVDYLLLNKSLNSKNKNSTSKESEDESSPWMLFTFALGIVLREGLEAILVILAILAVCNVSGLTKAKTYIHVGWISALFCGVLAWIFSGFIINMSGAQRELVECISSLMAVIILVYMGFWMHQKSEIQKWNLYIQSKTNKALSNGNLLSLAAVSFLAVFREALETVLFLRTLWVREDTSSHQMALLLGLMTAFFIIFIITRVYGKLGEKIPLKSLFKFSSTLMLILAVILTGKGIHSLQESGYLSMTPFPLKLNWESLGLYPTMETILSQTGILFLCLILLLLSKLFKDHLKS